MRKTASERVSTRVIKPSNGEHVVRMMELGDADWEHSYTSFCELRPHLKERGLRAFLEQVRKQADEGYRIVALVEAENETAACMGYRHMTTLAWGHILYIDDLIVRESFRGKGYAKALLEHAVCIAKRDGCTAIHLDSGYQRHPAHRLYLQSGFELSCHHLARLL